MDKSFVWKVGGPAGFGISSVGPVFCKYLKKNVGISFMDIWNIHHLSEADTTVTRWCSPEHRLQHPKKRV